MNPSALGGPGGNFSFFYYRPGFSASDLILLKFSQIMTTLTLTVYCCGTVSNTAIILVLLKGGFKLTTNICFFALAIVDFLVSASWIPKLLNFQSVFGYHGSFIVLRISRAYLQPLGEALQTVGSWITAIVAMERLCCIMFPLKVRLIFTRTSSVCLILAGVAYETIVMSVFFYGNSIRERAINIYTQQNRTVANYEEYSARYEYGSDIQVRASMAGSFGPNYGLYGLIIIETVVLVIVFTRSVRARAVLVANQGTTKMSTKEVRLIKSVIAVCVIYIVTCSPQNVFGTLLRVNIQAADGRLFWPLTYFARSLNHVMNIFAYLSMNAHFRAQFRSLFCFCCPGGLPATK